MIDTKNILFEVFHLVSFQVCYLLFLMQKLLIILEVFVCELIFWDVLLSSKDVLYIFTVYWSHGFFLESLYFQKFLYYLKSFLNQPMITFLILSILIICWWWWILIAKYFLHFLYSLNILNILYIIFFSSFLISFKNFSSSFNAYIFLLDLGLSNTFGLDSVSGADSSASLVLVQVLV